MRSEAERGKKTKHKQRRGPLKKDDLHRLIAQKSGVSVEQVGGVFAALEEVMEAELGANGAGECSLPGLATFATATRPAVKARRGVNPFTGEETRFAARPETRTVRVRALKKLKRLINR